MARNYKHGYNHTCDYCGEQIMTPIGHAYSDYSCWARSDKKFCKNACRQKAYRIRRRIAQANAARKT